MNIRKITGYEMKNNEIIFTKGKKKFKNLHEVQEYCIEKYNRDSSEYTNFDFVIEDTDEHISVKCKTINDNYVDVVFSL